MPTSIKYLTIAALFVTLSGCVVIKAVSRGFDGFTFGRGVDFYTVDVHNPHQATVEAEYWIEFEDRQWGHRKVTLSPGSTKTIRFDDQPQPGSRRICPTRRTTPGMRPAIPTPASRT